MCLVDPDSRNLLSQNADEELRVVLVLINSGHKEKQEMQISTCSDESEVPSAGYERANLAVQNAVKPLFPVLQTPCNGPGAPGLFLHLGIGA
ncbi:hypothetical protein TURU_132207 [Turdus rufiventris]|nr:hypothetical protein TURU_132207 [Turdus rufiventris]